MAAHRQADRERGEQDGVFVLKNGCVCCLSSGAGTDLERVLDKLWKLVSMSADAAKRATADGGSSDFPYDYVVVETSGLADPAPIIQTFFRSALSRSRFYMVRPSAQSAAWHSVCEGLLIPR